MKLKSTAFLSSIVIVSTLQAQTVRTWNGASSATWHSITSSVWGAGNIFAGEASGTVSNEGDNTDIMAVSAANTAANVGINMNNMNGELALGGIDFNKTNTTALIIGNNSTTVNGILQLNGATINSVAKTLVRVDGSANLTIANVNTGTTTQTMGLRLGITDGIFTVASGRTLIISSNITQVTSASGFTKTGTGVMLLGGTNSFTGNTTISGGTLVFRTTASKPASTTHTFEAGTVLGLGVGAGGFTSADVVNAFAGSFTGSLAGISIGSTNNIALDNGTFGGNIASTTRGLEKTDNTGNLTLTGNNQYSGRTVVGGGNALVFNTLGNKGDLSSNVGTNNTLDLKNGARMDNAAVNTSNKDFNLLGATATYFNSATINSTLSGTVSTETAGLKTFTLGGNSGVATPEFSGTISDGSGQLALTKGSAGQWTLSSANTYTGATIMSGGTLILSNSLALQNSPLNTTSSIAGTSSVGLRTTVTTLTLGGLTGNKALASLFNSSTGAYNTVTALTLNPATAATHTYDAAIANGAALMTVTKTGLGTQVLTVANTYTGATAVNAGTLLMGDAAADTFATSGVTVASAATLGGSGTFAGTLAVSGNLAPGNASNAIGTLNTGTTTWNGGTNLFQFNLAAAAGSSDLLAITGDFTKGSGTTFKFDFMGAAPDTIGNVYTLATWTGATTFTPGNFSFTGLTGAVTFGSFSVTPNSLQFTAVPEASNLLIGGLLGLGMMSRRRKQA